MSSRVRARPVLALALEARDLGIEHGKILLPLRMAWDKWLHPDRLDALTGPQCLLLALRRHQLM
jgi:hypothetical protein